MASTSSLPEINFVEFSADHIDGVVALGARFFEESEFPSFAEFSPKHFRMTLEEMVESPSSQGIIFIDQGQVEGFIFFGLDCAYTAKPIALMWLFYVTPEYRRSPIGRELLSIAEAWAKDLGATAFYGGSMAGIPSVEGTMRNLFIKAGYKELFWARKILRDEPDV